MKGRSTLHNFFLFSQLSHPFELFHLSSEVRFVFLWGLGRIWCIEIAVAGQLSAFSTMRLFPLKNTAFINTADISSGILKPESFPLNGWTARTGFRVILTACTDNAAATDDFFHDIPSLRIRGTNGFFKPSITELKASVNLFTVCIKNLRDEAFYLRKKKVSCGHSPHNNIFFSKVEALSRQCPAVPAARHDACP